MSLELVKTVLWCCPACYLEGTEEFPVASEGVNELCTRERGGSCGLSVTAPRRVQMRH